MSPTETRQTSAPAPGGRDGALPPAAILALIAGLALFLYWVRDILLPFALSGIVAYVCTPLVDRLARRLKLPRWLPALVVLVVLMALTALIAWLGIPAALRETLRVVADLRGSIRGFVEALMGDRTVRLLDLSVSADSLANAAVDATRTWILADTRILYLAAWGTAGLFGVILVWVLLGYFLIDAPRIATGLRWLVPPAHRPFMQRVSKELDPLLRRYFIGVALVVAYASAAAYIGLGVALGLHHAVFLAMLTGLLELIPIVGPATAAVIAGLVAVSHAATAWDILAYIAYAVALRVSIDQFFGPIVLGRAARVSPVVVIFCFLAGGVLFGVVGVILAVPVALTIKVILAILYGEPHTESG